MVLDAGMRSLVKVGRVCGRGAQTTIGTSTGCQREEAVMGRVVGSMFAGAKLVGRQ
jgi:hypothetical protein